MSCYICYNMYLQYALANTSWELLIVLVGYEKERAHEHLSYVQTRTSKKSTSEIIFSERGCSVNTVENERRVGATTYSPAHNTCGLHISKKPRS